MRAIPWKKTDSFPSSLPLPIVLQLGLGFCEHTIHLVRAAMLTTLIVCMLVETATAVVSSWVLTALPCLDHTVGGSPP